MFNYEVPEGIKNEFTKEVMAYFLEELIETFPYIGHTPTMLDDIFNMEGTGGWYESFKKTCINYGLEDILHYYNGLEWYDSDMFDDQIGDLFLEYGLVDETIIIQIAKRVEEKMTNMGIDKDCIEEIVGIIKEYN